jgi:CRP-like cAMP-binding protein
MAIPVQRVAHRDGARHRGRGRCASARIILRLLAEYPEMTVEIMRVLADRLSHTTAELTEERSKHRVTQ